MIWPTQTQGSRPMEASDARTLALTTPPLTEELLAQWTAGQQAFLSALGGEDAGQAPTAQQLAEAHGRALSTSGLEGQAFARFEALVRSYCGVASIVQSLERKLETLEGGSADQRARIAGERDRLLALTPLRQRYGDETVEVLRGASASLLELHARIQRALNA